MAAQAKSLLAIVLSFSIVLAQGSSERCSKEDIVVKQDKTGALVKGKPEFNVGVLNACPCLQGQVKFDCKGFQTEEKIDPLQLRVISGGECLLLNGSFVAPFSMTPFTYAWDDEFPFKTTSSVIRC